MPSTAAVVDRPGQQRDGADLRAGGDGCSTSRPSTRPIAVTLPWHAWSCMPSTAAAMVDQAGNATVRICRPVVTPGVLTLRRGPDCRRRSTGSLPRPRRWSTRPAAIVVTTGVLTLDDRRRAAPRRDR